MRAVRAVNGRSYRKLSVKLSVHSWPIIGTGRELATYATYNRIAYRAVGSILLLDRRVADNIKEHYIIRALAYACAYACNITGRI